MNKIPEPTPKLSLRMIPVGARFCRILDERKKVERRPDAREVADAGRR